MEKSNHNLFLYVETKYGDAMEKVQVQSLIPNQKAMHLYDLSMFVGLWMKSRKKSGHDGIHKPRLLFGVSDVYVCVFDQVQDSKGQPEQIINSETSLVFFCALQCDNKSLPIFCMYV